VVKILDLGLVRSEAEAASGLTKQIDSRSTLGTADYVAPEQAIDSSGVDIRADIYSLGATLYFLLAGHPLFPEGRTAQKLVWQQIKDPPRIDELRPEVPAELAAVVHRMLAKKPEGRFATPAEVFDALAPFVTDEVPAPDPNWLPPTPARVAVARAAMPGSNAPRVSGSTSQILAAAMRGGSGSLSGSSPRRPGLPASDTDELGVTPSNRSGSHPTTDAAALDETQRPPDPRPSPPAPAPNHRVIIYALAGALAVALGAVAVLLLGK
jgi:serine/threonine-protein kinase